jgi:hypothetical protein
MSHRSQIPILVLVAAWSAGLSGVCHADNLVRLFVDGQASGFYSDNIPLTTKNPTEGDFAGNLVGGFYLYLTSPSRHASLQYATLAQLFAHRSNLDQEGKSQFVRATDLERFSSATTLSLDESFIKDSPAAVAATTSDQGPMFNGVLSALILAHENSMLSLFGAQLSHSWSNRWLTQLSAGQKTLWSPGNNVSYAQHAQILQSYKLSPYITIGPGYRYYDFRFTVPGRPGADAHWMFANIAFIPIENLTVTGFAGPVVTYTFGTNKQGVDPAGLGIADFRFPRGDIQVRGGQVPSLTAGLGGAGKRKYVRGGVSYQLTRRLTASFGASFNQFQAVGVHAQLIAYGTEATYRMTGWLTAFARYRGLRVTKRREAVANYYILGFSFAFEALRRSFQ